MAAGKRRLKRLGVYGLPALLVLWLAGDFVYSRVVLARLRRWESSVSFDADGVRAGCADYTLGGGRHALLLVHGFNDSPACYYRLAPALAERGYTCRVMRLPGFGMSTAEYARYDHQQWLQAIAGELAGLRAEHERVSVIAHSLGGALTIRHVVEHPDTVDAVVLLAPAVAVNDARSPVLSARRWHRVASRLLVSTDIVENVYPLDGHSAEARAYPYAMRFVPQRATTEFFAVVDGVESLADRFTVPLLSILAKEDQIVDWRAAARFHEHAASPAKQLVFAEDAGHLVPFDHGWPRHVESIDAFLRSVVDDGHLPDGSQSGDETPIE